MKRLIKKANVNQNMIINEIYNIIDNHNPPNQCHYMVQLVEEEIEKYDDNNLKEKIKYIYWDETKWQEVAEILKNDDKKFGIQNIDFLIEDISDFSVNGHSFIKVGDEFVDPYLYNLGTSQKDINLFGEYLYAIYKKVGII